MSKKSKVQPALCKLPPVAVGTRCLILRPNLWSRCVGVVESYNVETGLHRMLIDGKDGYKFHADATAAELQVEAEDDFKKLLGL